MIPNGPNIGVVFTQSIQLSGQVELKTGGDKYVVQPVFDIALLLTLTEYWLKVVDVHYHIETFSVVIFETYFSYDHDIWITATDYYLPQGGIILLVHLFLCLFVC